MDMLKMRDFMTRLQQAHQQAVDAGDSVKADQFAAIADQAGNHVKAAAMQGPPGQEGPAGVPGRGPTQLEKLGIGSPQDQGPTLDMLSQPPDVQRDAANQGSFWESLFKPQSMQKAAQGAVAPNPDKRRNAGVYFADEFAGPAAEATMKAPYTAAHTVSDNIAKWLYPTGHPGQVAGTGDKQDPIANGQPEAPAKETVTDDEKLKANLYGNGRSDVGNAAPPPPEDPYASLGANPENGGIMDILGILLGGKNYLNYKDRQVQDYQNKRFAIGQQERQGKRQDAYHTATNAQAQAKLESEAQQHLFNLSEKQAENEDRNDRAILNGYGTTTNMPEMMKNPDVRASIDRLNRKRQVEAKKGN